MLILKELANWNTRRRRSKGNLNEKGRVKKEKWKLKMKAKVKAPIMSILMSKVRKRMKITMMIFINNVLASLRSLTKKIITAWKSSREKSKDNSSLNRQTSMKKHTRNSIRS